MNLEAFRAACLAKKGVTEEQPFGNDTLVYKVVGKMFALTGVPDFVSVNLKCDPEMAMELREQYEAVQPGYHMNKKHWNTIVVDGSVSSKQLKEWMDHSYNLVIDSLPKKIRDSFKK